MAINKKYLGIRRGLMAKTWFKHVGLRGTHVFFLGRISINNNATWCPLKSTITNLELGGASRSVGFCKWSIFWIWGKSTKHGCFFFMFYLQMMGFGCSMNSIFIWGTVTRQSISMSWDQYVGKYMYNSCNRYINRYIWCYICTKIWVHRRLDSQRFRGGNHHDS